MDRGYAVSIKPGPPYNRTRADYVPLTWSQPPLHIADCMQQILYVSSKVPKADVSVGNILMVSRRNNDLSGVTGLLFTDGTRFLQVLEGDHAAVSATFQRIQTDPRHHAVVVLSNREVDERHSVSGRWRISCRPTPMTR